MCAPTAAQLLFQNSVMGVGCGLIGAASHYKRRILISLSSNYLFICLFGYLFLERGDWKEKERERNIDVREERP